MKDLKEMLEIEKKTTPGPWDVYHAGSGGKEGKFEITEYFVAPKNDYDDISIAADITNHVTGKPSKDNAEFIAESREFVPYAIKRLMEAERLIERAAEEIENCYNRDTPLSEELRQFLNEK